MTELITVWTGAAWRDDRALPLPPQPVEMLPPVDSSGKRCSKCGIVQARVQFAINRGSRDGRFSYCRTCKVIVNARRYA